MTTSESSIVLRAATSGDVAAITQIINALLGTTTYEWTEIPYSPDERRQWFRDKERAANPVLVAVDGREVVGYATFGDFRDSRRWPGYRFTVEHSIHVAESHWGRGVGRALLIELANRARADGRRVMVAAVDASNVRSIDFHARMGFVEVGRMPGVGEKWGRRLDLVLMQHELDEPFQNAEPPTQQGGISS